MLLQHPLLEDNGCCYQFGTSARQVEIPGPEVNSHLVGCWPWQMDGEAGIGQEIN